MAFLMTVGMIRLTRSNARAARLWRVALLAAALLCYGALWWGVYAAQASGCATQLQQFLYAHRHAAEVTIPRLSDCGAAYDTALAVLNDSLLGLLGLMIVAVVRWGLYHQRARGMGGVSSAPHD